MKYCLTILLCTLTITIYGQHLDVEGDARIEGKLNLIHSLLDSSVYIGANVGTNVLDGQNLYNTMVGAKSGSENTLGTRNAFFGYQTGHLNTTGGQNAFFGYRAGHLNIAGGLNAFFGGSAGRSNANGRQNAFYGAHTGELNIDGSQNSFFGATAGQHNDGIDNSFFGWGAGNQNISGELNVFVGSESGYQNTTGSYNSFFGTAAGRSNVSGDLNTFLGEGSGFRNTIGNENVFVGQASGVNNKDGSMNTFVGASAGLENISVDGNTYVGFNAGRENETGSSNAMFGFSAGRENLANSNAFIGHNAGRNNTTGFENTFIGKASAINNIGGNQNTFMGKESGFNNLEGSENVFIGESAGNVNVTGNKNTLLGTRANFPAGSNNLEKAVAIGYNAKVDCSSCAVIGGTGEDAVKVGIGTSTPDRELTIEDNDADAVIKIKTTATPMNELILGVNTSNGGWMRTVTDTDLSLWTNSLKRLTIRNTGEVQIHKLGIAGSQQLCLNAAGELAPCSSSRRYKDNIHDYLPDVTPLEAFRPVTYEWKDSGQKDIGLVAEEVAMIDPRLVTYNDAGQVEGVKYDRLGVLLIDVIKQQQKEINLLKEAFQEFRAE